MLVLTRRLSQKIVFPTLQTTVQVVSVKPGVVRLGIDAPENISVYREELLERNSLPIAPTAADGPRSEGAAHQLKHLLNNRLNASTLGVALLRQQLERGLIGDMAATLDRIEDNLKALKERTDQLVVEPPRSAVSARRRALIVEDDPNECELLAGFLRLAGLDVHTAGDGADALDYLNERGKPDVVLLDMMLPRCDGPTMVRTLRHNPAYADLTIYGVTGAAVEQFGLGEGPSGVNRWFRKPIDPEALLRELNHNASAPVRS
ncbi:MAG TPA: response regulator [Gemmataceae bacterium]|jgi:carbon storage regulator CsrA